MARPKGEVQRVPVKMRVNIGLMDRLEQLAAESGCSVPKLLARIMENALAELPPDYELHDLTEIYTLTKNHAVNLSSNRMNVYLLPGTQEAMLELARRMLEEHHQALRALMKQPDSRAKDLRARHLLSVIDALDWYVTNYDAIRRQFNSGKIATLFTSHRGDGP